MKKLYRFAIYFDCGEIESVFISTDERINKNIGKVVNFGEVLGKHSEVFGRLEKEDIKEISISQSAIEELEKVFGDTICGYNPLYSVVHTCNNCECDFNILDYDLYENKETEEIICFECYDELNEEDKQKYKKCDNN